MASPTPFRKLIIGLRIVAGLLAGAGMGLYIVVYFVYAEHSWLAPTYGTRSLTALPLGAAAYSVFWNIVALLLVKAVRPAYHSVLDFLDAAIVVVLGSIGFAYDDRWYLDNNTILNEEQDPWDYQEILAAVLLLISVLVQLALAVLNILEHRNAKKAGSRVPLPTYAEPQASVTAEPAPQSNDKDLEFELDAQSLQSFESYSSVKKPEPVNVKVLKQ